jgi:hypothetical protein
MLQLINIRFLFKISILFCPFGPYALQRINAENSKQVFPEKELRSHRPNFHINVSVSDLYILAIDLPIMLQEICGQNLVMYKLLTDT